MNVVDTVCRRHLDVADVVASVDHAGWTCFFCSWQCRAEFVAAPHRYGSPQPLGQVAGTSGKGRTHG